MQLATTTICFVRVRLSISYLKVHEECLSTQGSHLFVDPYQEAHGLTLEATSSASLVFAIVLSLSLSLVCLAIDCLALFFSHLRSDLNQLANRLFGESASVQSNLLVIMWFLLLNTKDTNRTSWQFRISRYITVLMRCKQGSRARRPEAQRSCNNVLGRIVSISV